MVNDRRVPDSTSSAWRVAARRPGAATDRRPRCTAHGGAELRLRALPRAPDPRAELRTRRRPRAHASGRRRNARDRQLQRRELLHHARRRRPELRTVGRPRLSRSRRRPRAVPPAREARRRHRRPRRGHPGPDRGRERRGPDSPGPRRGRERRARSRDLRVRRYRRPRRRRHQGGVPVQAGHGEHRRAIRKPRLAREPALQRSAQSPCRWPRPSSSARTARASRPRSTT